MPGEFCGLRHLAGYSPWSCRVDTTRLFFESEHESHSVVSDSFRPYGLYSKWNSLGQNRRRQWRPTPVLLPGKPHGRRSLVGCSPWGHKESDMTERFHFHFSLSCIGKGNGNPLQCSCLENPREGRAWWAAVYGISQSRTRLNQLSSSSFFK